MFYRSQTLMLTAVFQFRLASSIWRESTKQAADGTPASGGTPASQTSIDYINLPLYLPPQRWLIPTLQLIWVHIMEWLQRFIKATTTTATTTPASKSDRRKSRRAISMKEGLQRNATSSNHSSSTADRNNHWACNAYISGIGASLPGNYAIKLGSN